MPNRRSGEAENGMRSTLLNLAKGAPWFDIHPWRGTPMRSCRHHDRMPLHSSIYQPWRRLRLTPSCWKMGSWSSMEGWPQSSRHRYIEVVVKYGESSNFSHIEVRTRPCSLQTWFLDGNGTKRHDRRQGHKTHHTFGKGRSKKHHVFSRPLHAFCCCIRWRTC